MRDVAFSTVWHHANQAGTSPGSEELSVLAPHNPPLKAANG